MCEQVRENKEERQDTQTNNSPYAQASENYWFFLLFQITISTLICTQGVMPGNMLRIHNSSYYIRYLPNDDQSISLYPVGGL